MTITIEKIAEYLSRYITADYAGAQDTGKVCYNLYVEDGDLISPHEENGAERFIAWRDVADYIKDEPLERITATETLEDESFKYLCEDFMSQIRGWA